MATRLNEDSDASFKDSTLEYYEPNGQQNLVVLTRASGEFEGFFNSNKTMRDSNWRWVQLTLCVLFFVGNYYCYLVPATLQTQIVVQLKIQGDALKYNMIQSVYSLPNMIMPFFGGVFIDRLGMSLGIVIFSSLLLIGQIIQWQATVHSDYAFFIVGRIIFGLGGENMCITMNAFIAKWFLGTELSFALGISVASANLGSVLTALTQPRLAQEDGNKCNLALLVSVCLMAFSWLCALLMAFIEKKAVKSDQKANKGSKASQSSVHDIEKIQLADLKKLTLLFWLVNGMYMFMCAGLIPFQTNISQILQQNYSLTSQQAGDFMALPMILVTVITPSMGLLTDYIGKRSEINFLSSIFMSLSFVLFITLPTCPPQSSSDVGKMSCNIDFIIPLIVNGVGACLLSAVIYPCIALTCEKRILGTAYGILDCVQQIGMAISPIIAGVVLSHNKINADYPRPPNSYQWYDFTPFYYFFLGFCGVGLFISIAMIVIDRRTGNKLDKRMTKKEQNLEAGPMSVRLKGSFARGSQIL